MRVYLFLCMHAGMMHVAVYMSACAHVWFYVHGCVHV